MSDRIRGGDIKENIWLHVGEILYCTCKSEQWEEKDDEGEKRGERHAGASHSRKETAAGLSPPSCSQSIKYISAGYRLRSSFLSLP